MNHEPSNTQESSCCSCSRTTAYVLGGLGAFLVMGAMVAVVRHYSAPTPAGAAKAAVREQNLREVRAAGVEALGHYAVVDATKGLVKIPVSDSMKLVETGYKNPSTFRADLLDRLAKANPAPPPKPPEKPSQFE